MSVVPTGGRRIPGRCSPTSLAAALLSTFAIVHGACGEAPRGPPEPSVVRIALRDYPLTPDPHLRSELVTISVLGNVYESLVGFDGDGRVRPELASGWSNPDDLTWRFELEPGVTFHDGRPLGARDVVASLERARHHPDSNFSSFLVHVDAVRAVGPAVVEITTTKPHPLLLNKLAYVAVVPADSPMSEAIQDPVGSGPYRVVEWREGESVRLERYDAHRPPAPIETLEFYAVPSAEDRVEGLREGRFDLIQELPAESVEAIQGTPGLDVRIRPTLRAEYICLHPSFPPFDDPRVREAIDLAIDRETYVAREAGGFGDPLAQLAPRRVFGHNPDLVPSPSRRARARELLEEAGYGEGLHVVLEAREGRAVQELVRQLATVGIQVEVLYRPWGEMFDRLLTRKVPFYYDGIIAVTVDASDVLDYVAHSWDEASGYGQHNRVGYVNPEVDRLVEESSEVLDTATRREIMSEALELVAKDRVFIALYSPYQIWGASERLAWTPRIDGMIEAAEMTMEER